MLENNLVLPPSFRFLGVTLAQAGANRFPGPPKIDATNDLEAINLWLKLSTNAHTRRQYKKEIERFILWLGVIHHRPLSGATLDDVVEYREFLKMPRADFMTKNARTYRRSSPDWRPFAKPLAASSQRQAMIILGDCFSWLVSVRYLDYNIFDKDILKVKQVRNPPQTDRHLPASALTWMFQWVESLPDTPQNSRWRFLLHFFYKTGLRIHEAAKARVSDLQQTTNREHKHRWFIIVIGKGGKTGRTAFPLIEHYIRYRQENGLSDLPLPGDDAPLIIPFRGTGCITPEALRKEFRKLREAAADAMLEAANQVTQPELAAELQRNAALVSICSPHWMRHAYGTQTVAEGVALNVVQKNMRHASISTTMIYAHTEDDAAYDAMEKWVKTDANTSGAKSK